MATSNKLERFYKIVTPSPEQRAIQDSQDVSGGALFSSHSWYQRLVQGSSTRLTRYREYDMMDDDVDVARALDTIAEEMTQKDTKNKLPLVIVFKDIETNIKASQAATLTAALRYWTDIQCLDEKLFHIARTLVKYGDCFFDKSKGPTKEWMHVPPKLVTAAMVDESDVTKITGWVIRDDIKKALGNTGGYTLSGHEYSTSLHSAADIVHISLCDQMSDIAPFGESVLKPVYRSYKQKDLLEDSIIIYRIVRAPERRVFYVDVGKMPPHRSKQYLEQVKNEIRQKKIPTQNADGTSAVESVYNAHSTNEDFFFAQRADGKGSKVDVLPGGQGLGELADLEYFMDKVFRGLRVPTSYMSVKPDQQPIFNDGKVGQAFIEELRFAKYCIRLQNNIAKIMDREFKDFLRAIGIVYDATAWSLELPEPTNFGLYKQLEADNSILNTLSSASGLDGFFAKRYSLMRFAQMDEAELLRNERLMAQEKGVKQDDPDYYKKVYGSAEEQAMAGGGGGGLGDLGGIGGGGGMGEMPDVSGDMEAGDETMGGGGLDDLGGPGGEPGGEAPPAPGGEGAEPPPPKMA